MAYELEDKLYPARKISEAIWEPKIPRFCEKTVYRSDDRISFTDGGIEHISRW